MQGFEKEVDSGSLQWCVSWGGMWLPFGPGSSRKVAGKLGLTGEPGSARWRGGAEPMEQGTAWPKVQRCERLGAGLQKVQEVLH